MINHDYLIDTEISEFCDSGGRCDCLPIKNNSKILFKTFEKKHTALASYKIQKKLAKLELAPKLFSGICKVAYYYNPKILEFWDPTETTTGWGFITEKAILIDYEDITKIPYKKIQDLVDAIRIKSSMKFWDCHENNVGYIKRDRSKKLVCIDTGPESFKRYANAWGFEEPGPKCCDCNEYYDRCGC
jgi:hypothetical protein